MDRTESQISCHDIIGSAHTRYAEPYAMHAMPRWQHRCSRPSCGHSGHRRAKAFKWITSSATHPPQPPQPACEITTMPRRHGFARRCRTRLREEVDDGQGHGGGAEGSMSRFVGSCSRLAQPALSPRCPRRGWLTAGAASQRGTASSVERSTHEAIGRGRRRGRGLGVLLRAAATVSAGARQAGRRDQCRQREARPRGPFEGVLARARGGPLIPL